MDGINETTQMSRLTKYFSTYYLNRSSSGFENFDQYLEQLGIIRKKSFFGQLFNSTIRAFGFYPRHSSVKITNKKYSRRKHKKIK